MFHSTFFIIQAGGTGNPWQQWPNTFEGSRIMDFPSGPLQFFADLMQFSDDQGAPPTFIEKNQFTITPIVIVTNGDLPPMKAIAQAFLNDHDSPLHAGYEIKAMFYLPPNLATNANSPAVLIRWQGTIAPTCLLTPACFNDLVHPEGCRTSPVSIFRALTVKNCPRQKCNAVTINEALGLEEVRKRERIFEPKRRTWISTVGAASRQLDPVRATSAPTRSRRATSESINVLPRPVGSRVHFADPEKDTTSRSILLRTGTVSLKQSRRDSDELTTRVEQSQAMTKRDVEGIVEVILAKSVSMNALKLTCKDLEKQLTASKEQVSQLEAKVDIINRNQGEVITKFVEWTAEQKALSEGNEQRLRQERKAETAEMLMSLRLMIQGGENASPPGPASKTSTDV